MLGPYAHRLLQELETSRADAKAAREALEKAHHQHKLAILKRDEVPHLRALTPNQYPVEPIFALNFRETLAFAAFALACHRVSCFSHYS